MSQDSSGAAFDASVDTGESRGEPPAGHGPPVEWGAPEAVRSRAEDARLERQAARARVDKVKATLKSIEDDLLDAEQRAEAAEREEADLPPEPGEGTGGEG
jgi:hypothetical protein